MNFNLVLATLLTAVIAGAAYTGKDELDRHTLLRWPLFLSAIFLLVIWNQTVAVQTAQVYHIPLIPLLLFDWIPRFNFFLSAFLLNVVLLAFGTRTDVRDVCVFYQLQMLVAFWTEHSQLQDVGLPNLAAIVFLTGIFCSFLPLGKQWKFSIVGAATIVAVAFLAIDKLPSYGYFREHQWILPVLLTVCPAIVILKLIFQERQYEVFGALAAAAFVAILFLTGFVDAFTRPASNASVHQNFRLFEYGRFGIWALLLLIVATLAIVRIATQSHKQKPRR